MSASVSSEGTSESTLVERLDGHLKGRMEGVRKVYRRKTSGPPSSRDIFLFLVAFRILNALSLRTFFQPDEYFQSLEPAWHAAFGADSGAWITWEWKYHLRSSVHPYIFAAVYRISAQICTALRLSPSSRADLLIATPKVFQAVVAAAGDYYTWKLGQKVYGKASLEAIVVLGLSVCNPWQWFCSTRTLSNCLETTLTIVALNYWPWQMSLAETVTDSHDLGGLRIDKGESEEEGDDEDDLLSQSVHEWERLKYQLSTRELDRLRACLLLAAFACILRPTNVLIWICLSAFAFARAVQVEKIILLREIFICGSLLAAIAALFDRSFYGEWTFPPFQFLLFNVAQSLAVFYGRNDWHYYITQGYPLLLTTLLPFAVHSIYSTVRNNHSSYQQSLKTSIRFQLAATSVVVPLIMSLISHKEVRFIYPLLPMLHVLCSKSFATYFAPVLPHDSSSRYHHHEIQLKSTILAAMAVASLAIATFTSFYHQTAPLSVLEYLRRQHETLYLTQPPVAAHLAQADTTMTVGFFMPCHSTPWRSHLVHLDIKAWALGCEPPVHLSVDQRKDYLDEADRYYEDPNSFLRETLGKPPQSKSLFKRRNAKRGLGVHDDSEPNQGAWDGRPGVKHWPDYLVFFEGAEGVLKDVAANSGYRECSRHWNSFFHDDWRRRGDMIVWCLGANGS